LTDLYGSVDGTRKSNVTVPDNGNGSTASQSSGGRRLVRRSLFSKRRSSQLFSTVTDVDRRQMLLQRWDEINLSVMNGFKASDKEGWRVLHATDFGEAHEIELDEEFKVQIHALLA
jgi:hypothetical protein